MGCDALYLHIPFCQSKCPYCDFYSLPAREQAMDAYTGALCGAIAHAPFSLPPLDTVYLGGGTPSALGDVRLARILKMVNDRFGLRKNAEITIECNPCSATVETLRCFQKEGVNRLSMGMQSGNNRLLKRLGRAHDRLQLELAVNNAVKTGFSNLSLDLMLATPGQRQEDIQNDIALCDQLGAAHISAYLLKIEPGTPFASGDANDYPGEDAQADAYLFAVSALAARGYAQYEISNFCRNNKISRHNCKYWDGSEYLGIGPSAHSFVNGRRFYFPRDLKRFCSASDPFSLLVVDGAGGDLSEYLMLRLRLNEGVIWHTLAQRYPHADCTALHEKIRPLAQNGLLVSDDIGLRLTIQGMLVSNAVIGALLD